MRYLFILLMLSFGVIAKASNPASLFDPKLVQYYKVDTCKVYLQEPGDPAKVLTFIYVFNSDGLATQKLKVPYEEGGDTIITNYQYVSGLLVQELTEGEGRTPQEVLYSYRGRVPVKKVVKYFDTKEYEIFSDEEGMMLGMIGYGMVPEIDSLTAEPTGNTVVGKIDEYEYRYNRFKKLTREVYLYNYQEFYQIVFDYGPNGNQPLMSKVVYKMGNKVPDATVTYSYGGNSLVSKESSKDGETQSVSTTTYEYIYNPASIMLQPAPTLKSGPSLSPGNKKGR
jgi:hypothetical protein